VPNATNLRSWGGVVLGAAIKEKKTKQNIWGKNKKRNLSKDFKKTIPKTIRTRISKKQKEKKKKD
jgi:hypothetical protein